MTIDIGRFEDYLGLVVTDLLGNRSTRYKWYDMNGNPLVLDEVERLRDWTYTEPIVYSQLMNPHKVVTYEQARALVDEVFG